MAWTSHDSQTALEATDDLSAHLRAAEERIRELEAKVRLLEDRADRAERWVYKIWVEIEQKFFGGDAVRFWESSHIQNRVQTDAEEFEPNDGRTRTRSAESHG
jgi:hypothetical protein